MQKKEQDFETNYRANILNESSLKINEESGLAGAILDFSNQILDLNDSNLIRDVFNELIKTKFFTVRSLQVFRE